MQPNDESQALVAMQALQLGLTSVRSEEDVGQLEQALHFLIRRAAAIQDAKAAAEQKDFLNSGGIHDAGAAKLDDVKTSLEATCISGSAGDTSALPLNQAQDACAYAYVSTALIGHICSPLQLTARNLLSGRSAMTARSLSCILATGAVWQRVAQVSWPFYDTVVLRSWWGSSEQSQGHHRGHGCGQQL